MRYPAYPDYKESGVQWLGQVPRHWDAVTLKWISQRYAGGTPDKSNDAYWEDGDIPWLNSGSVNDGYITEPSAYITREGFANSSAKWIPENALVMALAGQGKTKGMVAQLGIPATCNQSMAAIIPKEKFTPRFLYWWLVSNYQNIRNMAGGEQRDGLNLDMLGSIPCPLLPLPEQTAIADFLDRETGRIDTLVVKKRRLIALLKEKRTALISRTVTRGLPAHAAREFGLEPHTRFKDSGIEWLGEVPEGWEVTHLKYATSMIVDCPHETPQYDGGGIYRVVRTADLSLGLLDLSNAYKVAEDEYLRRIRRSAVEPGDILYSREGERWGFAATAPKTPKVCLGQRMMQFRPATSFDPRYLMWHLNASCVYEQGVLDTAGSTAPHVNVSTIRNYWLASPALPEQTAIATYLDRETARIDKLVEKVEAAIVSLQEYRTALITAAVTGKIDVREAVNGVDRVDEVTLEVGCGG